MLFLFRTHVFVAVCRLSSVVVAVVAEAIDDEAAAPVARASIPGNSLIHRCRPLQATATCCPGIMVSFSNCLLPYRSQI